jgi:hypothetical protein
MARGTLGLLIICTYDCGVSNPISCFYWTVHQSWLDLFVQGRTIGLLRQSSFLFRQIIFSHRSHILYFRREDGQTEAIEF